MKLSAPNKQSQAVILKLSLALLVVACSPIGVQAEPIRYYAQCSISLRSNEQPNIGKQPNIEKMPCYVIDGTQSLESAPRSRTNTQKPAFFHLRFQNGTITQLTAIPGSPFRDRETQKSYRRVEPFKFIANIDGETIQIETPQPTSDRYHVDDQILSTILKADRKEVNQAEEVHPAGARLPNG